MNSARISTRSSAKFEARLAPKPPWTVSKMTAGRFQALKKAIVGLTMSIEEIEGSFKLNQHKSDVDHVAVATALGRQSGLGGAATGNRNARAAPPFVCGRAGNSRRNDVMSGKIKIGILGASGYTGADAVRLLARHPNVEIAALTANTHAGKTMAEVFPHFFMLDLPRLLEWEKVDWTKLDAVFCGLPHGTTQEIIAAVLAANPKIKILDMSADFRLRDMKTYAQWYGHEHRAPALQSEAVYGLTEFYRDRITAARLVACPGCYPTAALLALVPLAWRKLIDVNDIVIDAKSGVTGAGRGLKQNTLFSEAGEGLSPYSVGTHRHSPEIEQEIGAAAGSTRHRQLHAASDPDEPR